MWQNVRRSVFWITDTITGSKVSNHINNISNLFTGENSEKFSNSNAWNELARHVVNTVPYYKKLKGFKSLTDFPVVNKSVIRENDEEFLSSAYQKAELVPSVTSGSTGTPFKFYQDKNKKTRNTADTLYFAQRAGYWPGQKLIYLKIWAEEKMNSWVHYKLRNVIPIDVIKLSDDKIEALINSIERENGKVSIVGYVSALERICRYLDKIQSGKINCDVTSIITTSESLTEYVNNKMTYYFSSEVLARYSNLENGIIAQQVPGSDQRFLINCASYKLEILDFDSDHSVNPGQPGRIVVTDLYNYGMPFIRYDTGDVGILSDYKDQYGNFYLEKIEGRKLDILYNTSGEIISSYIMYKNMWKYTEIKQYQLIQEGEKDYVFKINVDEKFDKEKQLTEEFKKYLGYDATFIITYVDEIPLLSSGKRKKTVNNWKP